MAVKHEFNKKIKIIFTAVEKKCRKRTLIILMKKKKERKKKDYELQRKQTVEYHRGN
jgi:hypothetical protein